MNETLSNLLKLEIQSVFKNYDVKEMLDLYEELILLDTPVETGIRCDYMQTLQGFYAFDENIRTNHKAIINSESFMKKVLYVVSPDTYTVATSNPKLCMYNTLQEIGLLKKIPSNINISTVDVDKLNCDEITKAVICTYQLRNQTAHTSNEWSISEMVHNVKLVLIASVYAVWINRAKLQRMGQKHLNSQVYDIENYLVKIIKDYEAQINLGFKYVPLTWLSEQNHEEKQISIKILERDKHVMLIGEAGCGKSTALNYLEYCDALRYIKNESQAIPVKIELMCENCEIAIEEMICRKLNIPYDYCEELLAKGSIHLYMDGVNEIISSIEVKKTFALAMEKFLEKYSKIVVVLTDRRYSLLRVNVPTTYSLKKMTDEDIIAYAKTKKGFSAQVEQKIVSVLQSDNLSAIEFTPLIINQLVEIFVSGNETPEDSSELVGMYINALIKREYEEKKDYNAAPGKLDLLLTRLSEEDFDENGLHYVKVLKNFKNTCDEYGITVEVDHCLTLAVQLGILKRNGDYVDFCLDEYKMYFLLKAMEI